MTYNLAYNLIGRWHEARAHGADAVIRDLEPHQKLLLLSDGSLTLELEVIYGTSVEVGLKHTGFTTLSEESADYIGEDQENESMEREVWLIAGSRKLVYAHSLIPLACLQKELFIELEEKVSQPLGRVLAGKHVSFAKDQLQVASITCKTVADDLGIDPSTTLAARRYILSNPDYAEKRLIKGIVTEIFSPEVVPAGRLEPAE